MAFGLSAAWDAEQEALWDAALRGVHDGAPPVIAAPAFTALDALSTASQLRDAGYTPANGAAYPDSDLGNALRDVARLIKADVGLQVAAVDYGDWDMHAGRATSRAAGWSTTSGSSRRRSPRSRPTSGTRWATSR